MISQGAQSLHKAATLHTRQGDVFSVSMRARCELNWSGRRWRPSILRLFAFTNDTTGGCDTRDPWKAIFDDSSQLDVMSNVLNSPHTWQQDFWKGETTKASEKTKSFTEFINIKRKKTKNHCAPGNYFIPHFSTTSLIRFWCHGHIEDT